jgi:YidC/Oxa1 family membrane protein insertase
MGNFLSVFTHTCTILTRGFNHFPSSFQGLNLYVLTGIAAMLVQNCTLRQYAVQRMLRILVLPKNTDVKPVTLKESIDHLKKWFHEQSRIVREGAQ